MKPIVQTVTLPSGMKVKAKRPSVLSLITSAGFPQDLTLEVWKLIKKDKLDPDALGNDAASIQAWARLIEAYIPKVLVNPRVTEVTQLVPVEGVPGLMSGTWALEDIGDLDKQVLFLYGNDAAPSDEELESGASSELLDALRKFRDGIARSDVGQRREAVRAEAEQPAGAGPV